MAGLDTLRRIVDALGKAPAPARERALSFVVGKVVPYVGTSAIRIESMTPERVVASIPNRRKVGNHLGQVHAAAMALLAETTSGFVVGMNLPADKLPLIKTLKVDYLQRTRGPMRAVATLTPEQRERLRTEERGNLSVSVVVNDESDEPPIACEMIWAWVPKKRQ